MDTSKIEDEEIEQVEGKEFEIFDFAVKTCEKMRQLDILSITQSPQEVQLKTKDQLYKLSTQNINNEDIFKFVSSNTGPLLPPTNKKSSGLTGPAIKMAQLLHQLKIHLHKLLTPAPIMNPKFDRPELYNQILLRKLETDANLLDDDDLIIVNEFSKIPSEKINDEEIVSEIDLLKSDKDFNLQKEEAIKKLSRQISNIYDNIIKLHVKEEIKRRKQFRSYVDILSIQRKIEIYCSLFKSRNRGKPLKINQKIKF